jgi:hypothetical protein
MNHSGNFPIIAIPIMAFFMFTIPMLAGCAGGSVQVEFPRNHPANPEAIETEFRAPPNPFHTDVAVMEEKPETDSMMKHKMQKKDGPQDNGHNMGTEKENQSESESKMTPEHRKGDLQHKGHSQ